MPFKVMTVIGARPQFIKAAAVSRVLSHTPELQELVVHTGQHFDRNMSALILEELGAPEPSHHLGIHGGSHGQMTGRMIEQLEAVMQAEKPDAVLVYGDTNSTLAGALAAAKLQIPVVHVEAGLRSFNRRMPEETNRITTDHLSALLFCPTRTSMANLAREGIDEGVHLVGDVMYDAVLFAREQAPRASGILGKLGLKSQGYALATIHRAENTDDGERLASIVAFLKEAAEQRPLVLPLHPRTAQCLDKGGIATGGLTVCAPVGYFDMQCLLANASAVYTDSGGLQKEAYFHRVPCVTLRDETEWVETLAAGWNRLWTTPDYAPRHDIDEYGDGNAAQAITAILQDRFHRGWTRG